MSLTLFPNGLNVSGFAAPTSATFTIGTETAGDVINVAVQLHDGAGDNIATRCAVGFYLSDDADGDTVVAATQSLAVGTDGVALEYISNSAGVLITESDGTVDLDITGSDTAAETYYLVLIMPSGALAVSSAIEFAAD
jgi:hypothetical protein